MRFASPNSPAKQAEAIAQAEASPRKTSLLGKIKSKVTGSSPRNSPTRSEADVTAAEEAVRESKTVAAATVGAALAKAPATTTTTTTTTTAAATTTTTASRPPTAPTTQQQVPQQQQQASAPAAAANAAPAAPARASIPATATSAATRPSANGGKNGKSNGGSVWQEYRSTRLSAIAKWIYILLVALFFVALYCGDLTPKYRSRDVLPRLSAKFTSLVGNYKGVPGLTSTWNSIIDKAPSAVPVVGPRTSPALPRTSTLHAGDYIYNCLSSSSSPSTCTPTFFHLKDDGTLILARGTTPSKPSRTLWKSKTPTNKQNTHKNKNYIAHYHKDGSLEVTLDGKKVWKAWKFFQPKVLRPWPLAK